MRIPISEVKIDSGRRKADPTHVSELSKSIADVGLLNPITVDSSHTLIAGLHRLEAAKLLSWTEVECTVCDIAGQDYAGKETVLSWNDIVSVAVCGEFVLGLKDNGDVVVANGASAYRANTEDWKDIVAITAGQQFIAGLKKDGTLTAQGYNGYGETDIDDWKNITAISAGWQHIVGLDEDGDVFDENGNVYFTGYNSKEIISKIQGDKENWTNLIAISTGGSSPGFPGDGHVVGLKADKSVVAAGDNSKGQCEVYGDDWKDIIAIDAGDYHTVGLRSDGIVVTTLKGGDDLNAKVREITDSKIVAVSAGYGTTIALTADGHVVGTGLEWQGQLDTDDWDKIAC